MNIEVIPTDTISKRVADLLAAQLKRKPAAVLGMTTGSSPVKYGIFEEWIRREGEGELCFDEAVFVNPDELVGIDPGHPESYSSYMEQHLFRHLHTLRKQTHIPNGAAADLTAECKRFDQVLRDLDYVDWQLMGLGLNGHIAFIEPAAGIPSSTYVTDLHEENRSHGSVHFQDREQVPRQAITIGLEAVMKTNSIVLVAAGENKADIVLASLFGPVTPQIPASFLQLHPDVTVILDKGSSKNLPI